jgi:hypothetical protein
LTALGIQSQNAVSRKACAGFVDDIIAGSFTIRQSQNE